MTVESSHFIRIAAALKPTVQDLHKRTTIASRRSGKLSAGDRTEARRFEALHAAIDQCALASLWGGEPKAVVELDRSVNARDEDAAPNGPSVLTAQGDIPPSAPAEVRGWLEEGAIAVQLRLPHTEGETSLTGVEGQGPPPPAERWQSTSDQRSEAIQNRFHHLITRALAADGSSEAVVRPSDISNSVLTETLREHVVSGPDLRRIDLPVQYRDGSFGPLFPLHALNLKPEVPRGWQVLRFTLLSIRHVEMDTIVDGAWFRNARISLPREAGLTDQLAFDVSMQQLRLLLAQGRTVVHLYQTGLDTAVMGFYRAVVHHLLEHPGAVSIVPYYYRGPGRFTEGTPWTTA
jgi:hypothetical protein